VAALEIVDWPIALALGAGHALAANHQAPALDEALERPEIATGTPTLRYRDQRCSVYRRSVAANSQVAQVVWASDRMLDPANRPRALMVADADGTVLMTGSSRDNALGPAVSGAAPATKPAATQHISASATR